MTHGPLEPDAVKVARPVLRGGSGSNVAFLPDMAYSDYGGYAYKNGVRVPQRSDAVITDSFESVPGMWPGFAFIQQGGTVEDFTKERREKPNGHVVIGDSPIHVGLFKQSAVTVWLGGVKTPLKNLVADKNLLTPVSEWQEKYIRQLAEEAGRQVSPEELLDIDDEKLAADPDSEPVEFRLPEEARLWVKWAEEDNFYVYAYLQQGDTVWAGWSGYGVGAGLEDANYGYSTEDREKAIVKIWPDAIQ